LLLSLVHDIDVVLPVGVGWEVREVFVFILQAGLDL